MIIHSGLIPERWKPSRTFRRLAYFLIFASELVVASSLRSIVTSRSMSIVRRSSPIASAPIMALKSSPNSAVFWMNSSSLRSWPRDRVDRPGSTTM